MKGIMKKEEKGEEISKKIELRFLRDSEDENRIKTRRQEDTKKTQENTRRG